MTDTQSQGSEIARLLAQIRAEYEAAQRGLSGFAYGTNRHKFITQKMENMGKIQENLEDIVGKEASIALIVEQLNACPDERGMSAQ